MRRSVRVLVMGGVLGLIGIAMASCVPLKNLAETVAGKAHTCALSTSGTVQCWGVGTAGQLGDGTYDSATLPVPVSGITNAVSLSLGTNTSCAVLGDGTARCWGNNSYGELGTGTYTSNEPVPVAVSGLSDVVSISAGQYHTCAVITDGTARCWGNNGSGQLGDGTNTASNVPVTVSGLTNVISISAGDNQTCAVLSDGTARCWGYNDFGQLGDGTVTNSNVPVAVTGLSGVTAIDTMYRHSCAVLDDGTARCWGYNYYGQLGNATNTNSNLPVAVSGLTNAASVSVGMDYSCVTLTDGTARCWGFNGYRNLGTGNQTNSNVPVTVSGLSDIGTMSVGGYHACATLSDATSRCWGSNNDGQLGNGTKTLDDPDSSPLYPESPMTGFTKLDSEGEGTCAVMQDATVKCWGEGVPWGYPDSLVPQTVPGLSNVESVAVGKYHRCALLADETVKCWGENSSGELGDGTNTDSTAPVTVTGLNNVAEITAGDSFSCALITDGTAKCWGHNGYSTLGDGTNTYSSVPVAVSGLNDATSISSTYMHTCARRSNGTAVCWGRNSTGQLGNGSVFNDTRGVNSNIPVAVTGLTDVVDIASGERGTCATTVDGSVYCWGASGNGALGNPDYDSVPGGVSFPVTNVYVSNATSVSVGSDFGCANIQGGSVRCWGRNTSGQLGDGTSGNGWFPGTTVTGLSTTTEVDSGQVHTCTILPDSTARCWGYGFGGQLGTGGQFTHKTPTPVFAKR